MQTRSARLRAAAGQGVSSRAVPKTILAGSTFCIADERGDIDLPPAGLFAHDTRFLSRFVLLVNGARPELLTGRRGDPHEASYFSRNPLAGGLERDELEIVRRRRISVGLEEHFIVRNLGARRLELEVELELAADFADIFAVKAHDFSLGAAADTTPLPGPAPAEYDAERHILRFADTVSDLVTVITYSQPGERTDDGLGFHVSLAPHGEWELDLQFAPGLDAAEAEAAVAALPAEGRRVEASLSAWRQTVPKLTTSVSVLQRSYDRAIDDLAALRLRASDNGELIAAGLPWFMTVFGRDTIIASLQTLLLGQDLARTALRELARLQATEDDASIDAEPGKIVHELRSGKGASAFFARYYGTVDATPLFLVLLSEVWRWTHDDAFAHELREPALLALAWIDDWGDSDGDGFVEYERRVAHGLENQTWKDSHDSQLFHDGTQAQGAIAAAEVQGYVYDAKRRLAELARDVWDDEELAARLESDAAELRRRFDEAFWCERPGGWTYALALDGEKRPVNSLTSNVGHLLWSGIVPEERVTHSCSSSSGRHSGPAGASGRWPPTTPATTRSPTTTAPSGLTTTRSSPGGSRGTEGRRRHFRSCGRCSRRHRSSTSSCRRCSPASHAPTRPIRSSTRRRPSHRRGRQGRSFSFCGSSLGSSPTWTNADSARPPPVRRDWLDTLRLTGIPALGTVWTAAVEGGTVLTSGRAGLDMERPRRPTDHELERQGHGARRQPLTGQRLQQQLGAAPPTLEQRLAHGGETHVRGSLDVVEADDGQLVRDTHAQGLRRLEHAQGLRVGGCEDRRGRLGKTQQVLRDVPRHMSALRSFAHVVGTHREAGARQLPHVALGSIPTRVEPETVRRLVSDECDAPMTELEQVAGGEDPAFHVVGQDGRQDGVRRVDEHAGDLSRLEAYELDLWRDERDHDQPSARSPRPNVSNARRWRSGDSTSNSARSYGDASSPETIPRRRSTAEGFVKNGTTTPITNVRRRERFRATELGR